MRIEIMKWWQRYLWIADAVLAVFSAVMVFVSAFHDRDWIDVVLFVMFTFWFAAESRRAWNRSRSMRFPERIGG